MELENVKFMLDSIKILLECGEVEHAIQLIDAFQTELCHPDAEQQEPIE